MEVPVLETERLRLRALRAEDFAVYDAMVADEETSRYTGGAASGTDAWMKLAAHVGHWQLRGFGQWALERRSDGVFVGRAGLWFPEGWPELEVGWMVRRSEWGNGYAPEAAAAAVAWGERSLGLTRIASVINPANARSIRVAEKLGMRFERDEVLDDGGSVSIYAKSL